MLPAAFLRAKVPNVRSDEQSGAVRRPSEKGREATSSPPVFAPSQGVFHFLHFVTSGGSESGLEEAAAASASFDHEWGVVGQQKVRLGHRRETQEWGAAYSVVMTEACEHVGEPRLAWLGEPPKRVHDRMPAILPREDWGDWLDGPPDAAGLLCRPWELGMRIMRIQEPWVRR